MIYVTVRSIQTLSVNLDLPFRLTEDHAIQFLGDGHIMLRGMFTAAKLGAVEPIITAAVERRKATIKDYQAPIKFRGLYQQAFLQIMNIWQSDPASMPLVFSKQLARIATELMGTRGVRMFHDQELYK